MLWKHPLPNGLSRLRQKYKAKAQSTSALGQVLTYCSVIHISIYITLATRFDSGWCTVVIKCTSNQAHHIAKDISRADVQCWLGTLEITGFYMYNIILLYWVCNTCMVFQCCGRIFKNSPVAISWISNKLHQSAARTAVNIMLCAV